MACPDPAERDLIILCDIRAIDSASGLDDVVDVVVERGRIARLGPSAATAELRAAAGLCVEAEGLWLVPAFVDLHAHLREPGHEYKEDIESGLSAAAAGGYAHVCAMPNTLPVNDTRSVTEAMIRRAAELGGPSLHPIAAITVGLEGRELTEVGDLQAAGAVGLSDDGRCVMSAGVMRRALEYARTFDMPVIQHAEDHSLTAGAQMHEGAISTRLGLHGWPRAAEDVIVARDVLLAEATGARYHVAHVSTRGAIDVIREGKARGVQVTAEATPHHLMLTDEAVLGYDTACKVNPPLREARDVDALRKALADGTIDAIATDHAPHSSIEKDCEFEAASAGMIGLELVVPTLLRLVHEGAVPLARFLDALSRAPARIVGLEPPTLQPGAVAELCVINPRRRHVVEADGLRSKSRNSPFVGREGIGSVELTVAGGELVYRRPSLGSP